MPVTLRSLSSFSATNSLRTDFWTRRKLSDVKLVYSDVQPAQPPEAASNILYLDPGWPLADGCVAIPGYDIPILPASGVIQAAIYWAIASERDASGRDRKS